MKLHLLPIPSDHPKTAATTICGRKYKDKGPQQPEDGTMVQTACGKTVLFRKWLNSDFCNAFSQAVCSECLRKIALLSEDKKKRVLVVVQKSIFDKLEEWETKHIETEEVQRRVYVAISKPGQFYEVNLTGFTGLGRSQVLVYLNSLVRGGVLARSDEKPFRYTLKYTSFDLAADNEKLQDFINKVRIYSIQDLKEMAEEEEGNEIVI